MSAFASSRPSSKPGTIASRLAAETRLHRCVADADHMAVLGNPTRPRFVEYLERVYGFDAPLESAFAIAPGLSELVDLARRVKTDLLAQDLRAAGLAPDRLLALPHCALAPFGDAVEALGWMYVAEINASTHNLVVSQLARRTSDLVTSTAHLTYYDAAGPTRWHELDAALEKVVIDELSSERLVRAAIQAFDCVHWWLRPNAPSATVLQIGSRIIPRVSFSRREPTRTRRRRGSADPAAGRDVAAREPARASAHVRRDRTVSPGGRRS